MEPMTTDELLQCWSDGSITADELRELTAKLAEPEHQRALLDDWLLESSLPDRLPGASVAALPEAQRKTRLLKAAEPTQTRKWSGWLSWRPLAAAAAVVLFAGGLLIGASFRTVTPTAMERREVLEDGVALLTQSVNAAWSGGREPRAGEIVSAGRLQLVRGLAQLEFYSGVRLLMEGPADLDLISANRAVCHTGRIRAWVPPQARGFTVSAPEFELVDLGTEFGMEVGADSGSKVQVFDGEVELHAVGASAATRRLGEGAGLAWNRGTGATSEIIADSRGFPSFEDVRSRANEQAKARFAAWQQWNRSLADDPRIAVRYDFEKLDGALLDSGPGQAHGTIIGCERSNGRWAAKGALEFKRPGDRVRLNVPGTFEALTFSAWVRLDATPGRIQGLLLTDGYESGFPHWQISALGELRIGLRVVNAKGSPQGTGYGSPEIFSPRRVGVWTFLATTYDNREGRVCHYVNGQQVSSAKLWRQQTIEIGKADIGNWALPFTQDPYPIRNFIGRIDELTVWKVTLSEAELHTIYQETHP
jgi:ferric-dicitrate binding protein FerR (iron transport regulator)